MFSGILLKLGDCDITFFFLSHCLRCVMSSFLLNEYTLYVAYMFAVKCYIVDANFRYNLTLFARVMRMYTVVYFFRTHSTIKACMKGIT